MEKISIFNHYRKVNCIFHWNSLTDLFCYWFLIETFFRENMPGRLVLVGWIAEKLFLATIIMGCHQGHMRKEYQKSHQGKPGLIFTGGNCYWHSIAIDGSALPSWVLLLVKPATLIKVALLGGCFSRFLNCTNGTKSRNGPHTLILLLLLRGCSSWVILTWPLKFCKFLTEGA